MPSPTSSIAPYWLRQSSVDASALDTSREAVSFIAGAARPGGSASISSAWSSASSAAGAAGPESEDPPACLTTVGGSESPPLNTIEATMAIGAPKRTRRVTGFTGTEYVL